MKNKLTQLAKETGFKSEIISDEIWKYSNNENLRWLFWMTALQKWLREKHEIEVYVIPIETMLINDRDYQSRVLTKDTLKIGSTSNTYEKALEVSLLKGITLIKNN